MIWCGECRAVSDRLSRSRARLLSEPKIVLMDEPTAAISVRQVAEVLDLIRRLRDRGHQRDPDQPPDARCFRGLGPDRRAATRRTDASKPTAQSSPEEVTGSITGAIDAAWTEEASAMTTLDDVISEASIEHWHGPHYRG